MYAMATCNYVNLYIMTTHVKNGVNSYLFCFSVIATLALVAFSLYLPLASMIGPLLSAKYG